MTYISDLLLCNKQSQNIVASTIIVYVFTVLWLAVWTGLYVLLIGSFPCLGSGGMVQDGWDPLFVCFSPLRTLDYVSSRDGDSILRGREKKL